MQANENNDSDDLHRGMTDRYELERKLNKHFHLCKLIIKKINPKAESGAAIVVCPIS